MRAVASVAVLRWCRNQKRCSGAKSICFFGISILIGFSSCHSFLNAESKGSPLAQSSTPPKNSVKLQACFFNKRAEGWHWYEDREQDKKEEPLKQNQPSLSPSSHTPTEKIEAQRKALEQKLHVAILEPTRENITSYLLAQRALMDQSQRFSEEWKKVVMAIPALDETLIHPVDQNARRIYYDERNKDLSQRIKALARDYGLFFFFRENCPYCHSFAPIVKRFSQKYGWSVLAISMDGGILPEFFEAKRDNGISKLLQVSHVPALIAFHPKTKQLIPLAYGMVSESEIEARIDLLTQISEGTQTHGAKK